MNTVSETSPRRRFRFTLRSLFILMSIVATAAWIFMHYRRDIGFDFAVVVLCAGWCILRSNKIGTAIWLTVFAVGWIAMQFFGPYTSLHNRVVWVVGTERLQQWAVEVLDDPPSANQDGLILLERESLPEDVRRVAGYHNEVLTDNGRTTCVSFEHGNGVWHWWFDIGRPGYVPPNPRKYDKLADGVWEYREWK